MRLHILTIALVFVGISFAQQQSPKEHTADIIRKAFETSNAELLKTVLPRSGGLYVVEGDIGMTDQELEVYVNANKPGKSPSERPSVELLLNLLPDGRDDIYRSPADHRLTYAVDKSSFPNEHQYQALVSNMALATQAWVSACRTCGIEFVHVGAQDSAPSVTSTNFVVRAYDARGAYIAQSFYPHDAPLRRYLNLDPTYFTTSFNQVGILRHELGHVLGYRHEHIQGIQGCYKEDNQWRRLTDYDPLSVMHYPCGGGGSYDLVLTQKDIDGHRATYGPPPTPIEAPPPTQAKFVVQFAGGLAPENIVSVLARLTSLRLIASKDYIVQPNDSLASIFQKSLNLTGAPKQLKDLIQAFDGADALAKRIFPNQSVKIPDVNIHSMDWSMVLDNRKPRDKQILDSIKTWWRATLNGTAEPYSDSKSLVNYKVFELSIDDLSETDRARAAKAVRDLHLSNVLVYDGESIGTNQFFTRGREYVDQYRKGQPMPLGNEGTIYDLIGFAQQPVCAEKCKGANLIGPIVLLDQPVSEHPDFRSHVKFSQPTTLADPTGKLQPINEDFVYPADHGTYMAGILACQRNSFGLIGIAPDADIESWNWPELSRYPAHLVQLLQSTSRRGPLYLFASAWKPPEVDNILAQIRATDSFFVVAAGENLTGLAGADIDSDFPYAPMKYGRLHNFIVVTACENCDSSNAHLEPDANYSTHKFVHVAAPGDRIPGTLGGGGYDVRSGTSPAAALTAGLVYAMKANWCSYYYRKSEDLKFRLQLTSKPKLGADNLKVAAGIIDARAALLDPEKNWRQLEQDGAYVEMKTPSWRLDYLRLMVADNPTTPTATRDIRRIVRTGDAEWAIYAIHRDEAGRPGESGEILRLGPGTLTGTELTTKPILCDDGRPVTLSQIQDVILSETELNIVDTCSNPPAATRVSAVR